MVQTLSLPDEFFAYLQEQIKLSERRIVLSALYLGVQHERERMLLDALTKAMHEKPTLELFMIFDFSRSSRSSGSIIRTLRPLVDIFKGRLKVHLYRMPQVEGSMIALPNPLDEVTAVYHCKFMVSIVSFLLIHFLFDIDIYRIHI